LTLRASSLFASLPFATVPVAAPGILAGALWALALLLFAGRLPTRIRLRRAALPLGALALLAAGSALAARLSSRMTVVFFSVGQGDAALVRFPGGSSMLVDAGGSLFGTPVRDPGAADLLPALAELGVARLDRVVLTHPHPDHAGGLFTLLERIPIGELWLTGEPGDDGLGDAVAAAAGRRGIAARVPAPGAIDAGGVRLEVLAPARWDPERSTNDNSIVLRLVHGGVSLLLAGDIEAAAEAGLAQGGQELGATLLKAPHHGSRTSSTDAFLRRVRPRHVVFCVGAANPFGFPHRDVVERYREAGCRQWRTDQGAVIAQSDGRELLVEQWR